MKKHTSSPGFYSVHSVQSPSRRALVEAQEAFDNARKTPPGTPVDDNDAVLKLLAAVDLIEANQSQMAGELAEVRSSRGKIDGKTLMSTVSVSVAILSAVVAAGIYILGLFVDNRITAAVASIERTTSGAIGTLKTDQAVVDQRITSAETGLESLRSKVAQNGVDIATLTVQVQNHR